MSRDASGCQTCTIACQQEHGLPPDTAWRWVADCEVGEYPDVRRLFVPMQCMHCASPPCVPVCPTGASRQRPDGIVWIDAAACVGCGYCAMACPYQPGIWCRARQATSTRRLPPTARRRGRSARAS